MTSSLGNAIKAVVFAAFLVPCFDASACPTDRLVLSGNIDSRSETPITLPDLSASLNEHLEVATASNASTIYDSLGTAHTLTHVYFHPPASDTVIVRVFATPSELVGYDGGTLFSGQLTFREDGERLLPDLPANAVDIGTATLTWSGGGENRTIELLYNFRLAAMSSTLDSTANGAAGACPQYGNLDFDGDGKDDFAVFRPSFGIWAISLSSTGHSQMIFRQWGLPGDTPMAGDFTGDGLSDLVVWRPSNGNWYVCRSEDSYVCDLDPLVIQFGLPGDVALEGDYTGDRVLDFAVWRPSTGTFYMKDSQQGSILQRQWGLAGDIPLDGGRSE